MDVLSQDQVSEFKEFFGYFDPDKTGTITKSNLKSILRQIGLKPTDAEVDEMIKDATGGRDGIKFAELVTMFADKLKKIDAEDDILRAFECFDTSGSGEITQSKLREVLLEIGGKSQFQDREVREIAKVGNESGDGNVDYGKIVKDVVSTCALPTA